MDQLKDKCVDPAMLKYLKKRLSFIYFMHRCKHIEYVKLYHRQLISSFVLIYKTYDQIMCWIDSKSEFSPRVYCNFDNKLHINAISTRHRISRIRPCSMNPIRIRIPSQINRLLYLTTIWMDRSDIIGQIPTRIGNIARLSRLDLSLNQITGSIPSQIENLLRLTHLSLNANQLTGKIPTQIGNLSRLVRLYLYSNQLTGKLPTQIN